jgi:hypothetical protein
MEVKGRQSLMEGLLPTQSFDAARAPSWIEFAFFDAVSRRKAHQSGANESAAESEADKEQQAPERKPKQAREFFGLNHFSSAQKGFAGPAPD